MSIKERIFNHWASSVMAILLFAVWFVFVWFDKVPWWSIFLEVPFSIGLLFVKDSVFSDIVSKVTGKYLTKD